MKDKTINIIRGLLGGWVRLGAQVIMFSARDSHVRFRLGQVYTVIRQAASDNYADISRKKYNIDPTVSWGLDTILYGGGEISIGQQTYIGRDSFIVSHPVGAQIVIGKYCAISHSVHIRTAKYNTRDHFREALNADLSWGDVMIGDYVWIGAHVVINGGVTIGNNSVVGANSVVTKDIPANSIYGGVPARLLNQKNDYPIEAIVVKSLTKISETQ